MGASASLQIRAADWVGLAADEEVCFGPKRHLVRRSDLVAFGGKSGHSGRVLEVSFMTLKRHTQL
jgi:hypothetical protein